MTLGLIILEVVVTYVLIGVLMRFCFSATGGDKIAHPRPHSLSIAFVLLWPFALYGLALRFARYIKRGR